VNAEHPHTTYEDATSTCGERVKTRLIRHIDPETDANSRVFALTFDIDWAADEIVSDALDLVLRHGMKATWFATHPGRYLELLRAAPNQELGVHPNFNSLLNGGASDIDAATVVAQMLTLVPDACSVRSHSVTQSSVLTRLFIEHGLTHESNDYIPFWSSCPVSAWRLECGMVKVPYCMSDELCCVAPIAVDTPALRDLVQRPGLKVFDFHPIHVFLNTESLDRYERTRPIHHDPSELVKHRFDGYGTRSRLIDLLTAVRTDPIDQPIPRGNA